MELCVGLDGDSESAARLLGNDDLQSKMNQVAKHVAALYDMLREDGSAPNAKTLTCLIYAFTKTGNIDEAFALMEQLVARSLHVADYEAKEKR